MFGKANKAESVGYHLKIGLFISSSHLAKDGKMEVMISIIDREPQKVG